MTATAGQTGSRGHRDGFPRRWAVVVALGVTGALGGLGLVGCPPPSTVAHPAPEVPPVVGPERPAPGGADTPGEDPGAHAAPPGPLPGSALPSESGAGDAGGAIPRGPLALPPTEEELGEARRWARGRQARCARVCRRVLILTAPEESLDGRYASWLDDCRRACVAEASEGQLRCLERVRVAGDVVACRAR